VCLFLLTSNPGKELVGGRDTRGKLARVRLQIADELCVEDGLVIQIIVFGRGPYLGIEVIRGEHLGICIARRDPGVDEVPEMRFQIG
jgi:hypothetical protein